MMRTRTTCFAALLAVGLGAGAARAAVVIAVLDTATTNNMLGITGGGSSVVTANVPTVGTSLIFDRYVSNPQPGGSISNNNSNLYANVGTYTGFTNPVASATTYDAVPGGTQQLAPARGILVTHSTGTVRFADWTGAFVTSDLLIGDTASSHALTLTFVDPTNTSINATVSKLAFRIGSIISDARATFKDINGVVIGTMTIPTPVNGNSIGAWIAKDGGVEASVIHSVTFSLIGTTADIWVLGSFNQSTAAIDMSYDGFALVASIPTPAAFPAGLLMLGTVIARRRR